MKPLIALISCHSRNAYANAQRETWIPLIPSGVDYRFFRGRGANSEPLSDEVFLDCGDEYLALPDKVRSVMRWSLENGYSHTSKVDDDVVCIPSKFLASGVYSHEFTGHRNDVRPYPVPYGFFYTLSKRAMQLVADSELPRDGNDEVYVTSVLSKDGITLHHDNRYVIHTGRQEDFAPKVRGLRAPKRDKAWVDPVDGPFAWVMYIPWVGYGSLPHDQNIAEMKRVFNVNR